MRVLIEVTTEDIELGVVQRLIGDAVADMAATLNRYVVMGEEGVGYSIRAESQSDYMHEDGELISLQVKVVT